jgi:DNA-binding MarR family transcriptional regulator
VTTTDLALDDLLALGLDPAEAAVLLFLLSAEQATVGQIRAATALTPTRTSTTISALRGRGLVDRVHGRRPSVVFVHPQAEAAVRQLHDAATTRREETAVRAHRGLESLLAAARRSALRGRPLHEVRPNPDPLSPDYDLLRRGHLGHDEVAHLSPQLLASWMPSPLCPTRLLLVTPDPFADGVDLSPMSRRVEARPVHGRFEVRTTTELHVEVLLLDAERVGVSASSDHGRVRVWSREPAHARAAADLFELWWRASTPHLDLPARTARVLPEPDYDVDEWDPNDLADPADPADASGPPDPR